MAHGHGPVASWVAHTPQPRASRGQRSFITSHHLSSSWVWRPALNRCTIRGHSADQCSVDADPETPGAPPCADRPSIEDGDELNLHCHCVPFRQRVTLLFVSTLCSSDKDAVIDLSHACAACHAARASVATVLYEGVPLHIRWSLSSKRPHRRPPCLPSGLDSSSRGDFNADAWT